MEKYCSVECYNDLNAWDTADLCVNCGKSYDPVADTEKIIGPERLCLYCGKHTKIGCYHRLVDDDLNIDVDIDTTIPYIEPDYDDYPEPQSSEQKLRKLYIK
jgi:hypothetical protein